jgi:hypothetical protein
MSKGSGTGPVLSRFVYQTFLNLETFESVCDRFRQEIGILAQHSPDSLEVHLIGSSIVSKGTGISAFTMRKLMRKLCGLGN